MAELEKRLGLPAGTLKDEELARAEAPLDEAPTLVLAEAPKRIADASELDAPRVVLLVALKAARREFENPGGINQETQGEHTIGLSEASGVYLTGRKIGRVRRAAPRALDRLRRLRPLTTYNCRCASREAQY